MSYNEKRLSGSLRIDSSCNSALQLIVSLQGVLNGVESNQTTTLMACYEQRFMDDEPLFNVSRESKTSFDERFAPILYHA